MIFKKFALIVPIIIISSIILYWFPYFTNAEITNWKTYINPIYGIRIDYPSTWLVNESITSENIVALHNPRAEAKLNFYSNTFGQVDYSNYSAVGIFIQNVSSQYGLKNITLEDYTAIKLNNILARSPFSNITKFENFSLGGYPAYKVEYTENTIIVADNSHNDKMMSENNFTGLEKYPRSENYAEVWAVKNDLVYSITSIIDNTDAYLTKGKYDVIQKIIDSFDFT